LVVLKDEELERGKELSAISHSMYPIRIKYSMDVSVHPVTQKAYEKALGFFLKRVKKEGREL
jgi:hypothetical protein